MRPINRIAPKLPVHQMTSYQLTAPAGTHFRKATCKEVDCWAHVRGWATKIDVNSELGARQAKYIRLHSGRTFTTTADAGLITFKFPAGQTCFTEHRVPLERDPLFIVRGGDWRGAVGAARQHANAADWVDEFANHQNNLAEMIARG